MRNICLLFLLLVFAAATHAQSVLNYVVQVSAQAQVSPPAIILSWNPDATTDTIRIYRKSKTSSSFGVPVASLPGTATSWTDNNVQAGQQWEYALLKTDTNATPDLTGYGYLFAGIQAPVTHYRGTLLLVVDTTYIDSIRTRLSRLEFDLVGDGWNLKRIDVSRNDSVTAVKNRIKAEYTLDPGTVKAVFLFGRVPVPYSGNLNPDGHPDHQGAWPADGFYAEMNSNWTDANINNAGASRTQNQNIPGDGKFDQSLFPSDLELQIGRVDFNDMPAFGNNESLLLNRYLDKNHDFRHKLTAVVDSGIVDDNFGTFSGEAFASSGWRNFAPLIGRQNTVAGDYFTTLRGQNVYMCAYGTGGGTYTSAAGVGGTSDFAAAPTRAIFGMLFGSYHGDWDAQNNFMRASLAGEGNILTCAWSGRPWWHLHHMGQGENIGYSARVSMNNNSLYAYNYGGRFVHQALMGDPSLRIHRIAPAANLVVDTLNNGNMHRLHWTATAETVLGYHIYRSSDSLGPYLHLNTAVVTDTAFVDSCILVGANWYMVRAFNLQDGPSGSYYNLSQGIFGNRTSTGSLTMAQVNPGPYCTGDSMLIPYTLSGPACPGITQLIVELSDSNGSFASPQSIGFWMHDSGSPIRMTVPGGILPGSGYRIRLRGLSPGYLSPLNTLNLVMEAAPVAGFTLTPSGTTYTFTDQSQYATAWSWTFGDGDSSALPSPTHTYWQNGTFTVTQIVTNPCGTDTLTQTLTEQEADALSRRGLLLYPNPSEGDVWVKNISSTATTFPLEVYDMQGRKVLARELRLEAGESQIGIRDGELTRGIWGVKGLGRVVRD